MAVWERTNPLRQTGRLFDSAKGFAGEGPTSVGSLEQVEQAMSWTSEDRLDEVDAGPNCEGSVLWWKGFWEVAF